MCHRSLTLRFYTSTLGEYPQKPPFLPLSGDGEQEKWRCAMLNVLQFPKMDMASNKGKQKQKERPLPFTASVTGSHTYGKNDIRNT